MKLFVKILVSTLLVVLILASIGAGIYWYNWSKNAEAKAIDVKADSTNLKIGEPTTVTISVQAPWYRSVEKPILLSSNNGASLTDQIEIKRTGFNFSGYTWDVKAKLILFEEGSHKDLSVILGLSPDREKKQKDLSVTLPEFSVSLAGFNQVSDVSLKDKMNSSDLLTLEKAEESHSYYWIWPALAALIIAIIALIYIFTRKKQGRVLSPWESARISLTELKKELALNDEAFFVRLSDILRQYIERRFALPATEKTSEEFIQQLRTDSILSEKQRIALERFLGTADLVKFARMNSDEKQKNECLAMADSFVDETIPQTVEGLK